MRQRFLLLAAATLTTAACADSSPLQPVERTRIRPNAAMGCLPDDPTVVSSLAGIPSAPVEVGSAAPSITISAAVTGAPAGSQATIAWSDGSANDVVAIVDGIVTGAHTFTQPGTYTVWVMVGCKYVSGDVVVTEPGAGGGDPGDGEPGDEEPPAEVPPTSGSYVLSPDPVPTGTEVPVTATFTGGSTTTATVDWGDGTVETVPVTDGQVTTSHVYEVPGVYSPTVTSGGVTATPSAGVHLPVYDPSGGFVTGGGWIDTPAGSYAADAGLIGKATFGLVVKTKKDQPVPEGNVEFQFHPAKLNFKSQGFSWLVVTDTKATFQGWGTINGGGDYGFMIVTSDLGRSDTFRMQIWNRATGQVVYDNEMGVAPRADATTPLTNGNIVVHTR